MRCSTAEDTNGGRTEQEGLEGGRKEVDGASNGGNGERSAIRQEVAAEMKLNSEADTRVKDESVSNTKGLEEGEVIDKKLPVDT